MTNSITKVFFLSLFGFLLIISCKKEEDSSDEPTSTQYDAELSSIAKALENVDFAAANQKASDVIEDENGNGRIAVIGRFARLTSGCTHTKLFTYTDGGEEYISQESYFNENDVAIDSCVKSTSKKYKMVRLDTSRSSSFLTTYTSYVTVENDTIRTSGFETISVKEIGTADTGSITIDTLVFKQIGTFSYTTEFKYNVSDPNNAFFVSSTDIEVSQNAKITFTLSDSSYYFNLVETTENQLKETFNDFDLYTDKDVKIGIFRAYSDRVEILNLNGTKR